MDPIKPSFVRQMLRGFAEYMNNSASLIRLIESAFARLKL